MIRIRRPFFCLAFPLLPLLLPAGAWGRGASTGLADLWSGVPAERVPSGVLYDRVLPLSGIEEFDGGSAAARADAGRWRQLYEELRRAAVAPSPLPSWQDLDRACARIRAEGAVPLALLDLRYDRAREEALREGALVLRDGRLVPGGGEPFIEGRAVALAALSGPSFRGEEVRFRLLDPALLSDEGAPPRGIEIDFDDGRGPVPVSRGRDVVVRYASAGEKTLRARVLLDGGSARVARALFEVKSLRTPPPHDTLHITASIPYNGASGTGDAYVYLSGAHSVLTEPVIVIEGFDYDNTMNWDELYALLNRENLLEDLRALGFDAVVLNFADAVTYIQRNAMVAVELIEQVQAAVGSERTIAVAGASMGGLIGRYALAYMEAHGRPHQARTFLSFDSPQEGANIPLGIQYWLWFFQDDSAEAAALLAALDTPGARQMLAYHHTDPPGSAGEADPLRVQLQADFAAIGGYPGQPRLVSIANGSGARLDQGFPAGAQIISWEFYSWYVDVIGNVWAVPDAAGQTIFHGVIDILGPWYEESSVAVAGTRPYDNAPGGWRDSMAEMDAVPAPYGDIVALHPNHAFIPTTSALALDTTDLFYDVAGDPDLLAHTPFDAVYFPSGGENQEHVAITAENAAWFLAEVRAGATAVTAPGAALLPARIHLVSPNPVREGAWIRFSMPKSGPARLSLHDATGRSVALLSAGWRDPGEASFRWDRHAPGMKPLAPGVYFLRLSGDGFSAARRVVLR